MKTKHWVVALALLLQSTVPLEAWFMAYGMVFAPYAAARTYIMQERGNV